MIKCCRFVKVDSLRQHLSVQDENFLLQSSFKIIPMNSWHEGSVCCTAKTAVIQTPAAPQVRVSVYLWWVSLQRKVCLLNTLLCKLFCKRKTFMDTSTAAWKLRGFACSCLPVLNSGRTSSNSSGSWSEKKKFTSHSRGGWFFCCIYKAWDWLCSKKKLFLVLGAYCVLASSKFSTAFAFNVGKPKLL